MLTAFERLIANIPETASVMDVGYGGLDGENTTKFLRNHFKEVWGLSKDAVATAEYKKRTGSEDLVILGLYPQDMPGGKKWDLLVLDPNIESNLEFWSDEGIRQAWNFVKEGGHIITYIMTTDEYGDEETQKLLKDHRAKWWKDRLMPPIYEIEERRPEITWVLLERPNEHTRK